MVGSIKGHGPNFFRETCLPSIDRKHSLLQLLRFVQIEKEKFGYRGVLFDV